MTGEELTVADSDDHLWRRTAQIRPDTAITDRFHAPGWSTEQGGLAGPLHGAQGGLHRRDHDELRRQAPVNWGKQREIERRKEIKQFTVELPGIL
jgi:hypothetical protein